MANYVKCILRMKDISNKPYYAVDDNNSEVYFSLQSIIPMPKSYDNLPAGDEEDDAIRAVGAAIARSTSAGIAVARYKAEEKKKEHDLALLGLRYVENIVKYGAADWFEWRRRNWGTKSEAGETEFIDDDTIKFETAYTAPLPVIAELTRQEHTSAELIYADENCGRGCGYANYRGGHGGITPVAAYSQEAFEIYRKCWGDTGRLVMVNGLWELKENVEDE